MGEMFEALHVLFDQDILWAWGLAILVFGTWTYVLWRH